MCGLRMPAQAGPSAPGSAAPSPTGAPERCPDCGTPREDQEAFCEECRHHFAAPAAAAPSYARPPVPVSLTRPPFPPPYERTHSRPSQMNRPAEPLPPDATITGELESPPGGDADSGGDFLLPPPIGGHTPTPEAAPEPPAAGNWTATVAADRAYYAAMMARSGPEAAGLYFPAYSPELLLPLLADQVTIGRRRHSTGESPDIDLSRPPEDPGVSHRHAVLVRRPDGGWSVVDQGSTNGTTVNYGEQPLTPFQPVDLADGDRVHVGAWTTITLRRG